MKNVLENIKVKKIYFNAYSAYVETPTIQVVFENFTFDALPFHILGATWQETNDWYVYDEKHDDFTYTTRISAWYTVKDKITGEIDTLGFDDDGFFGTDSLYLRQDLPETRNATYLFIRLFLALITQYDDETVCDLDDLDENDIGGLNNQFSEMIKVFYKRKYDRTVQDCQNNMTNK